MPPAPASKHRHWSKVEAGQEFTLVLKYDENLYRPATVTVRLRRHATTGLTQSAEPIWEWAVKTPHGEGEAKVTAAAKHSGFFAPPLILSGTKYKNMQLKPMHQCKLLSGYDCEYSMTSRASSVASSPCTNRPVTCPICGLYGWSYNMEVHVASGSCAAARGGAVVASYVPAHHEREWLEPFLRASKSKLKACEVTGCACKRTTPKGKGRAPPGV